MSILKDIPELVNANVISQEIADHIINYYNTKKHQSQGRIFVVFGVLGAILIGLGIILIIAHNWDEFSRSIKAIFAFIPLLIGQVLCGYSLVRKSDSDAWRESCTAFLIFAVGASISLVGQIYNIPGNLSSFLLTWLLLIFPLIYVMKSSIASLLYLIGLTCYASETITGSYDSLETDLYWPLFAIAMPYYYLLYKQRPKSNFMIFHNWVIPISIAIILGTVAKNEEELMFVAYISLFSLMYLIGNLEFFKEQKSRNSGYLLLGSFGTIILLLVLSFNWFWEDLRKYDFQISIVIISPEFFVSIVISLLAATLVYNYWKNKSLREINLIGFVFILFAIVYVIGLVSSFAVVLINLMILSIGIFKIREGAKKDNLGILNYGLMIISVLIICRFFDTDLTFVVKGILFVMVGIGFFITNFLMLKKRKANV